MKTKKDMLDEISSREACEEATNPATGWCFLRERIDGITTIVKKQLEKLFRVKLVNDSWESESFQNLTEAKASVVDAVKKQIIIRRAKCKAKEIGLAYWPALLQSSNVDPVAFVAAEKALLARGAKPWGTKILKFETSVDPKNRIDHGGWDSAGHWGISPQSVASCWFASGCKDSPKFRYLVRHTSGVEVGLFGHKLKGLSLRQLRDLRRGQKWLEMHFKNSRYLFSTKAVIALGRISPAARKAATANISLWGYYGPVREITGEKVRKIRIRDLDWSAVKALQTMSKEEITVRYLAGRYAWQFLGDQTPIGLEKKFLPPIDRQKLPEELKVRTMTFETFSLVVPEGFALGEDENGKKIFEVENPEEDYHFDELEVLRSNGARGLISKLHSNAELRKMQREAEILRVESDRAYAMMMDNLHLIMVSRHDSYRAGNCAAGTANFANRNGIDQRQLVRADCLHRLAKGGYDTNRVMGAIRCAWERETIVMI